MYKCRICGNGNSIVRRYNIFLFCHAPGDSENANNIFYPKKKLKIRKWTPSLYAAFVAISKELSIHTRAYLQTPGSSGSWTKSSSIQGWERPHLRPGTEQHLSLYPESRHFSVIGTTDGPKYAICPENKERFAFLWNTACCTQKRQESGFFVCFCFVTSKHIVSLPNKGQSAILIVYLQGARLKCFVVVAAVVCM